MKNTFQRCAARIVLIISFAAFLYSPSVALAVTILGSAQNFAVLGGAGVTGTVPVNTITGNLGACCITDTVTGYPAAFSILGGYGEYAGSVAPESVAQSDVGTAILALNSLAGGPTTTKSDLTGDTLPPGVYVSGSAMSLSGTLNLDGGGNANALWVFLMTSSLTINSGSTINVYNTGAGAGVYWVMGASAYLDSNSLVEGNFLAYAGIPVDTNVTDPCGRLLTQTGSVTLAGSDTIGIGGIGNCSGILAGSSGLGGGGTLSENGTFIPAQYASIGGRAPQPRADRKSTRLKSSP